MARRGPWAWAVPLVGVLAAAAVFVWLQRDTGSTVELVERESSEVHSLELVDPAEMVAAKDAAREADKDAAVYAPGQVSESASIDGSTAATPDDKLAASLPPLDVAGVGQQPLTDEAFDALVERLRADPDLLAALIDQARSEGDMQRLERLLRVLGDVDDPAVVALATELVYSGDPALQGLGLDLMKRVRPGDPDVLASVSGLLSNEVEGQVLVPALTALAIPGGTDDGTRATLASQVAVLTGHSDPEVRRTSLTILSRWSNDATYTPQLLTGLDDTDAGVRRAAAFALVGHGDTSVEVQQRLLRVADTASSGEPARRGAILALKRMPLDDATRGRVLVIERGLDSRPLR